MDNNMDYEKKYKEALGRAREFQSQHPTRSEGDLMVAIFPELAESEDKRITRAINNMLPFIPERAYANNGVTKEDVLTWLKKQGEQKPVDKVEPEFKVGEWAVDEEDNYVYQVRRVNLTDSGYFYSTKTNCHHWTIQDAKDGDVLVASDGSIFLFAGVVDCACKFYVVLTAGNNVKIKKPGESGYWETSRAVHPATKEERDLLFQKMKEAGYEWDAKKKELKRI